MCKIPALLFITACLFVKPAYIECQSFQDALSVMDNAINSAEEEFTQLDAYYLGRAVAANILASYKPYTRNSEAVQYVNAVCQALAINSSQPEAFNGYHVMILDSNEFNAFATPGGHIFITKRLIEAAVSEDMLAAVIAHELAHVILRHSINIINEMKFTNEMTTVADRASAIAARNSGTAGWTAAFRSSVTKTVDILMINGYSQSQEFEADLEAVIILSKAGYDPKALLEMLEILQKVQASQRNGFYSTHPSPEMRIANIEKLRYPAQNTRKYRTARFKNVQL